MNRRIFKLGNVRPAVSIRRMTATFFESIFCIIGMSTKKKMLWIYALRCIAFMQNFCFAWNDSFVYHPRNTVSHYAKVAGHLKFTITAFVCRSYPEPTIICFMDVLKKSGFERPWFLCPFSRNGTTPIAFVAAIFRRSLTLRLLEGEKNAFAS
jgi:hypothetical protein